MLLLDSKTIGTQVAAAAIMKSLCTDVSVGFEYSCTAVLNDPIPQPGIASRTAHPTERETLSNCTHPPERETMHKIQLARGFVGKNQSNP